MVQLTKEETEAYLENRRQKGFNSVLVLLIVAYLSDNPPMNKNGDAPFTTPNDFSAPNEAYFTHVEWVIQKAREKGILLILNPCVTGTASNKVGFKKAIVANGATKCRNYGRYIGNRFKDHPSIIWQAVGDQTPPASSDMESNWLEILQAIKEVAPDQMWTAHYTRSTTARDQPAFAPYMDLDNAYGRNRSYIQTLRAYNRAGPKPTFYNEGYYEDTGFGGSKVGKPPLLRAQAYWALLSGATGQIFGSDHIWPFGGPFSGPEGNQRWDWRAGMDRQGSREMVHVKKLFEGRAWHELVPDQDHSVITSGYGTFGKDDRTPGGDYVTAAHTSDGSLVMAYVPSTGIEPRTITVNMAKLSGAAQARWFNPTDGNYRAIAGSPFANDGSREFTTPGDNGTGTNDWVLVLEAGRKD